MFASPDNNMGVGGSPLPNSINPTTFPAKLWRLVNNPANKAICWDIHGEVIIIDQHLFEKEILSPSNNSPDNADAFKTTHFSSFVRQLNLYGFKKVDGVIHAGGITTYAVYHYFQSPNFKKNHPELVASLKRLTVDNKAKLQAGLDVKNRPPSRYMRIRVANDGRGDNVMGGSCSLLSPTYQPSPYPYYPNKAQVMMSHNRTPVPPRFLLRAHAAALSPTTFAAEKVTPVCINHHYTEAASSSTAMDIQQGLSFNAPRAQYQPGYYSPFFQYYHSNLVASHLAGSGLQTKSFSPHYYQASCPVNMLYHGNLDQDKDKDLQEDKKCDLNLDSIFQIADEVMQTPATSNLVRVVTPEKLAPVPFPDPSGTTLNARPMSPGSMILAVSPNADLVASKQQEESVVSVSEQIPEDDIIEVIVDDAKDTGVIDVEISDDLRDSSQADTSTCTGSTSDN